MGASSSKGKGGKSAVAKVTHSPLPQDQWPYQGFSQQYSFMTINVEMQNRMGFNFSPGTSMMTSNVDAYYPHLAQFYKDGFKIAAFFRIPGSGQRAGFFSLSVQIPYQAVFCRKFLPDQEQSTTWQLKIEKSMIYMQRIGAGMLFSHMSREVASDLSHLYKLICENAEQGGRFVCMELTGQASSQGYGAAMQGIGAGMGIDLFFNMALHPSPIIYSYNAISVPIQLSYSMGFQPTVDLVCDWAGNLAQFINQGWKLADIFLVNETGMLQQDDRHHGNMVMPPSVMNSVWFFEKEKHRLEDPTPVYQCTYVEHYVKIKAGFQGLSSNFDVSQLCQEMGNQGWKLVCFVDTPKVVSRGMMSATMAVMLFFQRRLLPPPNSGLPPPGLPPPGIPPSGIPPPGIPPPAGSSDTASAPPYPYEKS